MATLILGVVGSAIGSAVLPAGLSILGATISGATIGGAIGSVVGSVIDNALIGGKTTKIEGPRLSDLKVQTSTEGAPIQRVYGRARVAGQIIWATDFKETTQTTTQTSGGKGIGGSSSSTTTEITEYFYSVSLAIGLAQGKIDRIGRVWSDGKPLNLSDFTVRIYKGTETQLPDSVIEAVEGAGNAPAYRGLAYIVFEDMPLARFGNRVPQLSFEVMRSITPSTNDSLEQVITAVNVIPGSGEFVYSTGFIVKDFGNGVTVAETMNNNMGDPDFSVSIDMLQDQLPNCGATNLVVTWFGDDLRCNQVEFKPGVELASKDTFPTSWLVNGITRSGAHVVSQVDGRPAFGGTPSDHVIVEAIQDLKARGFKVLFSPFILLDIPAGNNLPDPYNPSGTQPVYPWRGRITCDPAPGVAESPDKSAAAGSQVDAMFGAAAANDFSVSGTSVSYTGPAEWSYRRMILHYAHLCEAAGGVDGFLIGSEMRGITNVRESASSYPAVDQFMDLAADVSSILSGAKISYGADWSEYFGHQPTDGSNDVFFNLDPLWADSNIDFVGIDNYFPLSDWRDGTSHLDYLAGTRSVYDVDYLQSNIESAEGFDWYYVDDNDRDNQVRTNITDGAYGKPWVFRYKDIKSWWQNSHFNRPGGVEDMTATAWVPESKPIWFTEQGCPAIDKGTNQPNVFFDAKSSESATPYYSSGKRDDLIQRRYHEAVYDYWAPAKGNNPTSSVYAAPMVDNANMYAWTWDARPFPDFPLRTEFWSDGDNWERGHWLTGRVGQVPLPDLITEICGQVGMSDIDVTGLPGLVTGYVIDKIMSPRAALEPLLLAYRIDAAESEGVIKFVARGGASAATFTRDDLVAPDDRGTSSYRLTRAQESELPLSAKVSYIESTGDYRQATVESRRLIVQSDRVATAELPIVMDQALAQKLTDIWLMDAWVMREQADLALPPSQLALDPSDVITLDTATDSYTYRLTDITDASQRSARAVRSDTSIFDTLIGPRRVQQMPVIDLYGPPRVYFLDLPLLTGGEIPHAPYAAAFSDPWPGAVDIYKSASSSDFVLNKQLVSPAILGETIIDFYTGPTSRWDRGNVVRVSLGGGQLESKDPLLVLNGANLAAVQNDDGEWEVFQYATASLVSAGVYDLSDLLRGQAGTEAAMRNPVAANAPFVLLDGSVLQLNLALNERGLPFNWRYGPRDKALSDFAFQTVTYGFSGIGLRPLSPAHVTMLRDGSDDIDIDWIRRTRIGGDSWGITDVPLGEEQEAYEVDIMSGNTIKRTLTSTAPTLTYSAADQTTDFGSPPSSLTIRVHQLSEIFGRGTPKEVTQNV